MVAVLQQFTATGEKLKQGRIASDRAGRMISASRPYKAGLLRRPILSRERRKKAVNGEQPAAVLTVTLHSDSRCIRLTAAVEWGHTGEMKPSADMAQVAAEVSSEETL